MCTRLQQAAARAIFAPMENDRPLCGFVVLVVEDDADTRESLTALIREGLGCRVLSASSGCEALEIIDSKVRVDLCFPTS